MSWSAILTYLASVTSQPWFIALEDTAKQEFITWITGGNSPIQGKIGSQQLDSHKLQSHIDNWKRSKGI